MILKQTHLLIYRLIEIQIIKDRVHKMNICILLVVSLIKEIAFKAAIVEIELYTFYFILHIC